MDPFGLKKRKKEIEEFFEKRQLELDEKFMAANEIRAESEKKLLEYTEKLEEIRKEENELNVWSDQLTEQENSLKQRTIDLEMKQNELSERELSVAEKERDAENKTLDLASKSAELEIKIRELSEQEAKLHSLEKSLNELRHELEAKEKELMSREAVLNNNHAEETMESEVPEKAEKTVELNPLLGNVDTTIPNETKKKKVDEIDRIIQLPNGNVNKPYELELSELNLDQDIVIDQIIGLEEYDLYYDKQDSKIVGTPAKDGEKSFQVVYYRESAGPIEFRDKKVRILINPDPRSLWKNLDPPAEGLYFKENEAHDQLEFDDLRVVAASKRGRSHAHAGTFRDDHFLIKKLDSDWLFTAVADGAGSAEYSREGSRIACEKVAEVVSAMLSEKTADLAELIGQYLENPNSGEIKKAIQSLLYQVLGQGVMASRNAIIEQAKEKEHQVRDYSTTLIFTIMKKVEQGYFIASYAVGDGAVAIHKEKSHLKLLMEPDGGEYAGQTRFLTMAEVMESTDIWKRIRFDYITDFSSVLLMTDGVSDPKFQTDANLQKTEIWDELMNDLRKEVDFTSEACGEQLVNWLDFWSQGNHDDRTIAIITKIGMV